MLDVYEGTKSINKDQVHLKLHDTSGDDGLSENRKVIYKSADLILLCVSKADEDSFEKID